MAIPRTFSKDSRGLCQPADGHQRFLRLPEVRKRVPYSRATIYRKVACGDFPKPYDLGTHAVAWLESEIDAWILARIEARLSTPAPSEGARA